MVALLAGIEGLDGLIAGAADRLDVDVVGAASMVGEDDDLVVVDLGVAAGDDDVALSPAVLLGEPHAHDAVAEGDDLGRVAGVDAQLAGIGDEHEAGGRALIEGPVGTHELYVQLCHCLT